MFVTSVPVLQTLFTLIGKNPLPTPAKVTVSPPEVVTFKLPDPAPPIYRTTSVVAKSVELLGVTAKARVAWADFILWARADIQED